MPNEMTAAEAAETLELHAPWIGGTYHDAMLFASSYLRRVAAGEYKRVVYCDDCVLLDRSPCPARDPETGKTRNCAGYCGVGAPIDGKDDTK